MIRWKYALPRLTVLAVIALAVWLGLNPLVRRATVATGQSAIGAKVEIGEVDASLVRTEICLRDVRVANPNAPMENLFRADEVVLDLETDALLRRKFIVREGRVSGLEIGTDRGTSGALDPGGGWKPKVPCGGLARHAEQWLDELAAVLKGQLAKQVDQLESVRLARHLTERWPAEYERLEARADRLKWRVDNLRQLSRVQPGDPAKVLQAYQQAAAELREIEREIGELRGQVDRLHRQALLDKDAVVQARNRDVERIRGALRLEGLSPEALSEYLLGPELSRTISKLATWVHWGRQHLPSEAGQTQPARRPGTDILFSGIRPRPDLLIHRLVLDGEGRSGGKRFQFLAAVGGITSQPEVYGRPVVIRAQIQGQTTVQMEAVVDRTGSTPRDRITVNCRDLRHSDQMLGQPGQLAILVSPGSTHLWALLELTGEELSGQILVKQEPVELVPDLAPKYGGRQSAANLRAAMGAVREIRVVVDLAGSLDKPEWHLRSNLGPQLAAAVNDLFRRELETRRDELLASAHRTVDQELARFEQKIRTRQEELLAKLNLDGAELKQLGQLFARRLRVPQGAFGRQIDSAIGRGLPEGLPLRF